MRRHILTLPFSVRFFLRLPVPLAPKPLALIAVQQISPRKLGTNNLRTHYVALVMLEVTISL